MHCKCCNNVDDTLLARCKTCNQHFCNNQDTNQSLSHILKHIKDTHHNVFEFPNQCALSCQLCGKRNIVSLYRSSNNAILCDQHKHNDCIALVSRKKLQYDSLFTKTEMPNCKSSTCDNNDQVEIDLKIHNSNINNSPSEHQQSISETIELMHTIQQDFARNFARFSLFQILALREILHFNQ